MQSAANWQPFPIKKTILDLFPEKNLIFGRKDVFFWKKNGSGIGKKIKIKTAHFGKLCNWQV